MNDLLVIGGGPSGLAAALYAARRGLRVTLWDKRAGTIDKACGEGLMPGAVAALADLGVEPVGEDLKGIRYLAGERSVDAPFRAGPGRGVRRTTLHVALSEAVARAGVEVEHRCARVIHQDSEQVVVDGVRFSHVVAADGLHSPTRRALGLDGSVSPRRRYGLRRHHRLAPWTSYVEVHWSDDVEAYVTPVAADLVGVALLSSTHRTYAELLAGFPALAARLDAAEPGGRVMGAGPLRQRSTARVAGRVLLVGDAAGYVDALTGEGVALGLAQARSAVAAIVDRDLARYEHDWRTVTRRYRMLTASLLSATRATPVRRMLVPTAERLPVVFGAAVNALAKPA